MPGRRAPLAERFWGKVDTSGDGCWPWQGSLDKKGYGRFGRSRGSQRSQFAHRVAWFLAYGDDPPPEELIAHKCDNPPCVRPTHLFKGSTADNVSDKVAKGRHPVGESSPTAKLTEADVIEIRRLWFTGEGRTQGEIAQRFGVTAGNVGMIVRGTNWSHIPWASGEVPRQPRPSAPRGELCGSAKLTEDDVRAIRAGLAEGHYTQAEAARRFDVTPSAIRQIVHYRTWKHV